MNAPVRNVMQQIFLGQVVDVADPMDEYRVRVIIHALSGAENQAYEAWARVTQPVAGSDYGAAFVPDVGDQVVIAFLASDPGRPLVLGSLYHGANRPPEAVVENGVKVWSLTGKQGTRIAIDEKQSSTITLETPGGVRVELTDGGQSVTCTNGSSTVELTPSGVTVQASGNVDVQAAKVAVTAATVNVDAAMSKFSGVVSCDVLQTNTVIATTYTPGAGNVW